MLDNIKLTLYEFFGYLLPGVVALLAAVFFFQTVFPTAAPLPGVSLHPDLMGWVVLTIASYYFGHALQAIGNRWLRGVEDAALGEKGNLPKGIRSAARAQAARVARVPETELTPGWTCRIADEFALQNGEPGDREIFVYREGFYKGATIALTLLSAVLLLQVLVSTALLLHVLMAGASATVPIRAVYPQVLQRTFALLLCASVAIAMHARFRRFGEYRVTRAVMAFLVLSNRPSPHSQAGSEGS